MANTISEKCCYCGHDIKTIKLAVDFGIVKECYCPICGNYAKADKNSTYHIDRDITASYLFYSHIFNKDSENSILFLGNKEQFDKCTDFLSKKKRINITNEIVDNWYPKTFAEKVDMLLLAIGELSNYDGEYVIIKERNQLFFCKEAEKNNLPYIYKIESQINYISKYLRDEKLLTIKDYSFMLLPKGLTRIYELQKNYLNNKNVFVAMQFGKETLALREKIKEGIALAGYNARIMDEIEHNHQIIPEMLYEIKNSRFVIAELSHHNNGAYYEAGYALGLSKEVIHICDSKELKNGLHFDVAQVNTIVYDNINEIPAKLQKRIEATII